MSLDQICPNDSHSYLASIDETEARRQFDLRTKFKAEARASRERLNDEQFKSECVEIQKHCAWISVACGGLNDLRRRVGVRYQDCTLGSFEISQDAATKAKQETVVSQMKALSDGIVAAVATGAGLFMFGPVGSGKDHLLTALMMRAARCGYSVRWFNGMDLYGSFRDSMDEDTSEASQLRPLIQADILALSDPIPPVGEVTPYQRSMLFRVIDRRYRDRKPTWITANVATRAEADQRFGIQLVDRIADGALRLHCNWESHRAGRKWKD